VTHVHEIEHLDVCAVYTMRRAVSPATARWGLRM